MSDNIQHKNVTQKLIADHLIKGDLTPRQEIALKIDQTLTQDATGTLVMLELEAMGIDQVKTELSTQYVDHNLVQEDYKNPDDHLFLQSACQKFGVHYSRPGNGVSHPVHQQSFGKPGKTLAGSDSHTPAAGSIGMFALGAGGLEVAMAMAGQPMYIKMPKVIGVQLTGELPDWVSPKDIILEMLRRYGVKGAVGCVLEYYGPGLKHLSAMDRHVIANMGTELGATTTVFPSDEITKEFMDGQDRGNEWQELKADEGCDYDLHEHIELSELEPLISLPSSPGNVVPVTEVEGRPVYQTYIGSSANPGFKDFAVSAAMMKGRQAHDRVSYDVNPSARNILEELVNEGHLTDMIHAGARIHQAGCNGCIGMGQAPASGRNSLRTVPRNFPGRSGTKEDSVYLCGPEVATAATLTGEITDPRKLDMEHPKVEVPRKRVINNDMIQTPPDHETAKQIDLMKGPNVSSIPDLKPLENEYEIPVLLKVGDNISTDEIMPAGARVLPYRSNIPAISKFVYDVVDETYPDRALETKNEGGHAIVGGDNYGQGSSREHAAIAPRYLGLDVVIAKNYARIHWQNLINFGILPLNFKSQEDYDKIEQGDTLVLKDVYHAIEQGEDVPAKIKNKDIELHLEHEMSDRQEDIIKAGGLINWVRQQQ